MTGRRELWEVTRFSGQRRGFEPQCDCYRTDDPPKLHLLLEPPASTRTLRESSPSAAHSSCPASAIARTRREPATNRSRSSTARSSGASSSLTEDVGADAATAIYEPLDALQFVRVDSIDEVFDAAFSTNGAGANGRGRAATARIGAPFNPQGKDRT